jgi:DNA-binding CsgD family transcriptional regulator
VEKPTVPYAHLTPRQLDVLQLAAEGLTYKEVAHRLGIQRQTVKMHLMGAMAALNALNTVHAVARWLCMEPAPEIAAPAAKPAHIPFGPRGTGQRNSWHTDMLPGRKENGLGTYSVN